MERKKRVVPRETCVERFERGNHCTSKSKAVLNAQESAKVIVAERRRTESVGVLSITEKGGVTIYDRKH